MSDLSGTVCLNNRVILLSNNYCPLWFSFDDLTLNCGFKQSHFSGVGLMSLFPGCNRRSRSEGPPPGCRHYSRRFELGFILKVCGGCPCRPFYQLTVYSCPGDDGEPGAPGMRGFSGDTGPMGMSGSPGEPGRSIPGQ